MGFSFNAHTLAVGGQIEEGGNKQFLLSRGSVTVPQEGGFGEATVCDYSDGRVSFLRAESRVYGNSFKNRLFTTFANVTVYGVDIEGRVQADVLSASIISVNERVNGCGGESSISFEARIVGLVIDGQPYDVEFNTKPYREHGTFAAFAGSFANMTRSELEETARANNWSIDECQTEGRFHTPRRCENAIRATIASKIKPALMGDKPSLRQQGFTIEVPGFGLLHLGEVMLTVGKRGINLLRVERGMTLDDLRIDAPAENTTPPSAAEEPRPVALALAEMPMTASSSISGGYTVVSVSGNGTDFGPPP
jgi:hypothetical protein